MSCSTMSISFSSINVNISTIIINHHSHPSPLPVPSCAQFFRRINFTAKTNNMVPYLAFAQSSSLAVAKWQEFAERTIAVVVTLVCGLRILNRLKKYGLSGILSYGLLNTAYYLTTFLVVWFYITPSPGRMGYLAAVERALALAPFVDRGLSWFTVKFGFRSQGKVCDS
ncbi:hypothetical protein BUALT_Bualt01G0149500 [Buddleja alternifolia]|uniref:Uncharacterized protein n=1 Tax=Buddleja alternifolia TaxID=168488 RepID=A0AAV6YE81_9LAMI|nr:hypothetical protein BUALT_Bualt01G0149500 [Buddleja alternifolia]